MNTPLIVPFFARAQDGFSCVRRAGLLLSCLPLTALAAEPDGRLFQPNRAWLERYDSTLLSSRLATDFSWEHSDPDADAFTWENSLRWGIPLNENLTLGLQTVLPTKWVEHEGERQEGLGDWEIRMGLVSRFSPKLRYGGGVNVVFDTASDPLLGDGALILRPTVGVGWEVHDKLTMGCNLQYSFTPQDEGTREVSTWEIKFPVIFRLSDQWSAFLSVNQRWNLREESDRQRVEFSTSCSFGNDREYEWSVGGELPLSSEPFECKWRTGFTWFF
jgi:hypothetical protein